MDEIQRLALELRDDPRYEQYRQRRPEIDLVFNDLLGEQNKPINKASSPMERWFTFGRTEDFAPTEANILGNLLRPGAAVRNAMIHDVGSVFTPGQRVAPEGSDAAFMQGFQRPREVPSVASALPVQPGASEAQLWGQAGLGAAIDIGYDPLNLLPIPLFEGIGAGINAAARSNIPGIGPAARWLTGPAAQWFEKQTPTFRRKPQDLDIPIEESDQTPEYQAWLQKNAQHPEGPNPFWDVPLHPAEEARKAIAEVPESGPGGQQIFPWLSKPNEAVRMRMKEMPYEAPIGPARDPGQQELNFIEQVAQPRPSAAVVEEMGMSLKQLRAKKLELLKQAESPENDAALAQVDKAIAEMSAPEFKGEILSPIEDAAKPSAPLRLDPRQKMALAVLRKDLEEFKSLARRESLSASDELRMADLGKKIAGLKKKLPPEVLRGIDAPAPIAQPTPLEDLATIITGIRPDDGGLGMSMGVPRFKLTENSKAALDRWKTLHSARITEYVKKTGGDVSGYVKEKMPQLSADEIDAVVHYLGKGRIANFNASNLSPEEAEVAREIESTNVDLRTPASKNPLSYPERVGRAGTESARKTAEAISNFQGRDVAAGMDTLSIQMKEAFGRVLESVDPNERMEAVESARLAMDAFKKAGTAIARMLEARKHAFADLATFKEQAQILYEQGEISAEDMQFIKEGAGALERMPKSSGEKFWGMLHELGVNNLLSVMSNMRNIAGNTMFAPMAPLTRATQGVFNAAVARPVNKAFKNSPWKPFKGEDVYAREAGEMVKGYAKNLGRGMRIGGKYFQHETDVGVYRAIQKEIAAVENSSKLSVSEKTKKLGDLRAQLKFVNKSLRGYDPETGVREAANLTHRRQIPGEVGKHINTMTRGLSAMDVAFRYPMNQGAEAAIRKRLSIKNNIPLEQVRWTPEAAKEASEEAAYYTFNEALGGTAKKLQSLAQPKSAGSYALANVLVFMKNAINIGKVSLDHGALTSGLPLLDYTVGPLMDRMNNPGKYGVNTKSIARSLAGLGLIYTSYAAFKKAGWEFFPATDITSTDQAEQRRKAKVSAGVFAIDGKGGKHDLSQSQPATMFFNKMAIWDETQRLKDRGVPESSATFKNLKSQMAAWLDSSMLTGPRDVYSAWDKVMKSQDILGDNTASSQDKVKAITDPIKKYLSKQAASRLVPAFLDEINRTWLDKTARDPEKAGEFFKQRTPFLSQTVPPKVTWEGTDMPRTPSNNPIKEMTVGYGNVEDIDPVDRELLRLGVFPKPVSKTIDGVKLSSDERRGVRRSIGPSAKRALQEFISDPSYNNMPEFMKASAVERILSKFQGMGEKILMGNKDLADIDKAAERRMLRKTKGRSLTDDPASSFLFSR